VVNREFTVAGAVEYDRSSPIRWLLSHVLHNRLYLSGFIGFKIVLNAMNGVVPLILGAAFNEVVEGTADRERLLALTGIVLGIVLVRGVVDLAGALCSEVIAARLAREARDELYLSLLGKSQTFHNRQRVGDVMARANNDMSQLRMMITPGVDLIADSMLAIVVPLLFIAFISPQLLIVPVLWTIGFYFTIRAYNRRLAPVSGQMRAEFGQLNATLADTVTGIELVKSTAQEAQEAAKFEARASGYRDYFVQQGEVQARYLPPLLLGIATAAAFLQGLWLVSRGTISPGDLVAYMGLIGILSFPAFISVFTFSLVQLGIQSAGRILEIMRQETELDENQGGYQGHVRGEIVFDHVTFDYGDGAPILSDLSFTIQPGQTVAIVGQTGSGKTTLTKLVNRIYDVSEGRVLVDGVDVRDWSLESLRSQVSTIEQDVFLFSRSISENIGFSRGQQVTQDEIEAAAKAAQAHEFIVSFKDGYETEIGERGVTLSGGQRQRVAIARALLTDPGILVLDDSTSAVDSATEDEIQQAIRRVLEGRTTLLITHRLSQIRWADWILVLHLGRLVDQGTHTELIGRCELYRRIFAHYEAAPAEAVAAAGGGVA
jgi:ATP-binding cassette subfamily B protein